MAEAVVDIVFRDEGKLLPLVLDAAVEEQHRANAMVTKHEVEEGVDVSDHYRPERRVITLDVRISDTPIRPNFAVRMGLGTVPAELPPRKAPATDAVYDGTGWRAPSIVQEAAAPVQLAAYLPVGQVNRVRESWELLMDARERALLADITTKYETYLDMAMTEVSATKRAEDGSWLRANLTFEEIRSVSSELVDDPVPARVRDRRRRDQGSRETKDPELSPDEEERIRGLIRDQSTLRQATS
jgi:hypothetical protein